jgi:hypothetical protein
LITALFAYAVFCMVCSTLVIVRAMQISGLIGVKASSGDKADPAPRAVTARRD